MFCIKTSKIKQSLQSCRKQDTTYPEQIGYLSLAWGFRNNKMPQIRVTVVVHARQADVVNRRLCVPEDHFSRRLLKQNLYCRNDYC